LELILSDFIPSDWCLGWDTRRWI